MQKAEEVEVAPRELIREEEVEELTEFDGRGHSGQLEPPAMPRGRRSGELAAEQGLMEGVVEWTELVLAEVEVDEVQPLQEVGEGVRMDWRKEVVEEQGPRASATILVVSMNLVMVALILSRSSIQLKMALRLAVEGLS